MAVLCSLLLVASGAQAAASPWTTADQAGVANVAGVAVSPSGNWAAVATTTLELYRTFYGGHDNRGADPSGAAVAAFCGAAGAACGQAAFHNDSLLAFVANASLYVSRYDAARAAWSEPLALDTGGDAPLAIAWAPHGREIAYSAAVMLRAANCSGGGGGAPRHPRAAPLEADIR
jgi:hypothetical protein